MAYDLHLADRLRICFSERNIHSEEKEMMGGLTFMVNGKMCLGIVKNELMARIGPEPFEEALQRPGCRIMEFTGRPMKGYVFVDPSVMDSDEDLAYFVELALAYNPQAKASKKK